MERNGELSSENVTGNSTTNPESSSYMQLQTNHPSFNTFRNIHSVYPQHFPRLPYFYPMLSMTNNQDFSWHSQPGSCTNSVWNNGNFCNDCTVPRMTYCPTQNTGTFYTPKSLGD